MPCSLTDGKEQVEQRVDLKEFKKHGTPYFYEITENAIDVNNPAYILGTIYGLMRSTSNYRQ